MIVTWLLVAMGVRTGFARVAPTDFAAIPKASDWAATGHDCTLFAIADIDGDGFGDLLTVNGARQLCVAYTVEGWKASRWQVLAEGMPENVTEIRAGESGASREGREVIVVAGDRSIAFHGLVDGKLANRAPIDLAAVTSTAPTSASPLTVDPPPFEPTAPQIAFVRGDVDGDGRADAIGVFKCSRPHDHMVVRLTLAPREGTGDLDGDGLSDEVEARLGTDPLDRDTDDDGLLDGWEVAPPDGPGMPRGIQATLDAQGVKLDPRRQDVLVLVSRYEQLDETTAKRVVEGAKPIYAKIKSMNPDGSTGISLQVVWDDPVPKDQQGNWSWGAVGNARLPRSHRGIFHWMQITPGGGGQAGLTGDMGGCGAHHAAFAHELGHQLSLTHEGDSAPAWCPLYPSMMNYAFNYALGGDPAAIGFSDGKFSAVELNESALVERLPFKYEDLKYLAAPPFRFTLKPDGDGTLIDWNHNGVFDSGTVKADINYGGSTYCGTRHIVEVVGGAPALAYVGPTCVLATVEPNGNGVALRACEGDGKWSAKRMVPASATGASTRSDPVMVGGPDAGFVFVRNLRGWHVARFSVVPSAAGQSKVDQSNVDQSKAARPAADQPSAIDVGNLAFLVDLPACDLSAARVDGRVLLVSRHDDDRLEARWFDPGDEPMSTSGATTSAGVGSSPAGGTAGVVPPPRPPSPPSVGAPMPLELRSKVPVGVAQRPLEAGRGAVVMASSYTNSRGGELCLRATWFDVVPPPSPPPGSSPAPGAPRLVQRDTLWTRGESSGNNCTTRPVVVFNASAGGLGAEPGGQLNIFHTGWPDANGLMTAWRTTQVGNKALDEGWLTCMLYDVWTVTRVGVAFADGAQGAIYAYRWDSGDYGEVKLNMLQSAHSGWGIDREPMRDHDDGSKMAKWGLRHSILWMER